MGIYESCDDVVAVMYIAPASIHGKSLPLYLNGKLHYLSLGWCYNRVNLCVGSLEQGRLRGLLNRFNSSGWTGGMVR